MEVSVYLVICDQFHVVIYKTIGKMKATRERKVGSNVSTATEIGGEDVSVVS